MLQNSRTMRKVCSPPSNVRQVSWKNIEDVCVANNLIGKGVFANCFAAQVGGLKAVCIKLLNASDRYKSLFYSEDHPINWSGTKILQRASHTMELVMKRSPLHTVHADGLTLQQGRRV